MKEIPFTVNILNSVQRERVGNSTAEQIKFFFQGIPEFSISVKVVYYAEGSGKQGLAGYMLEGNQSLYPELPEKEIVRVFLGMLKELAKRYEEIDLWSSTIVIPALPPSDAVTTSSNNCTCCRMTKP